MVEQLNSALDDCTDAGAVVIVGNAKALSAGFDLNVMSDALSGRAAPSDEACTLYASSFAMRCCAAPRQTRRARARQPRPRARARRNLAALRRLPASARATGPTPKSAFRPCASATCSRRPPLSSAARASRRPTSFAPPLSARSTTRPRRSRRRPRPPRSGRRGRGHRAQSGGGSRAAALRVHHRQGVRTIRAARPLPPLPRARPRGLRRAIFPETAARVMTARYAHARRIKLTCVLAFSEASPTPLHPTRAPLGSNSNGTSDLVHLQVHHRRVVLLRLLLLGVPLAELHTRKHQQRRTATQQTTAPMMIATRAPTPSSPLT